MNQAELTTGGFQNAQLGNQITAVQSDLGDIQTQLCNGFSGVNATVNSGFANAETAANSRQMANMQQAFANQTAMSQGFNSVTSQLADCCCENRLGTADLKYTIATENCADRQALNEGVRDIIASQTAGTQRILDQLCSDKIDEKNDTIAQLRQELLYSRGQASQGAQTAAILASNDAQTNALEQYLAPVPRPAYVVQNPNCCGNACNVNCGCGA